MSNLAFTDIGWLVTNHPELGDAGLDSDSLGGIRDAAMVVADGKVVWVGKSAQLPEVDEVRSLGGMTVIPGFVDSHAHLMFAGDRSQEFAARMAGQKYSAGGIRSTVAATRIASDEQLLANLRRLEAEMLASGITTFETKSGYGLDVETEVRSLRLAREVTDEVTFLGAHVVPDEYAGRSQDYVELVAGSMLAGAKEHSKWIDVFCDRGAFTGDEAFHILQAGKAAGLQPRVHANQLEVGLGVEVAVAVDAASADHCTHLTDSDIELLAGSNTVATLLPGAEFSTRAQYPDARRLLAAGATIALATDCNPGSSYTTSMAFCIAVAVRDMHLTPDEAILAATQGGAKALRRSDVGHLGIGANADFSVLEAPSHLHLAYRPGVNLIHEVWRGGKLARSNK